MPYTTEKTFKLASRLGGIALNTDGSAIVSWDMLDELGGVRESRSRPVPAVDVPRELTIDQLFEWADAKVVTHQRAHDEAEAAAIEAKRAEKP